MWRTEFVRAAAGLGVRPTLASGKGELVSTRPATSVAVARTTRASGRAIGRLAASTVARTATGKVRGSCTLVGPTVGPRSARGPIGSILGATIAGSGRGTSCGLATVRPVAGALISGTGRNVSGDASPVAAPTATPDEAEPAAPPEKQVATAAAPTRATITPTPLGTATAPLGTCLGTTRPATVASGTCPVSLASAAPKGSISAMATSTVSISRTAFALGSALCTTCRVTATHGPLTIKGIAGAPSAPNKGKAAAGGRCQIDSPVVMAAPTFAMASIGVVAAELG